MTLGTQEVSIKGLGPCLRCASLRWASAWALTLTAVVEFDVAVDVAPIVDLDFDQRPRFFDEDSETTRRSTYKVEIESTSAAAVQVDVLRQRQGRPQRLRKDVPAFNRNLFSPPRALS
jgi:hypothetical protein